MDIQNPHDKFFKSVISQSEYAGQLISMNVPKEISVQLDWKRLRQMPGSFIDKGYKESFTDALFSIPYRGKEEDVLIGVLVEHKSYPDPKVFSQLLRYQSNIYSSMGKMPILLQLFYHGKEKWNLPLSFFESLDLKSEDRELFRGNVLDFRYQLIDVSSEEYNNLNFSLEIRSILYTLKNIWHLHKREYIRAFSHEFLSKLRRTDYELYKKIVDYWWGFVSIEPEEILKHISQKEENIMKSTMTQLLERGRADGIETGIEKGIERGIKKGRAEGIETGIKKGRAEGKLEAARTMLRKGYALTDIIEITGLTAKQLKDAGINGKTTM